MSLIKNVGSTDKIVRVVVGAILLVLAFLSSGGITSTIGLIAIVVGAILILTAVINFCPLYRLLGIGTTSQID